MNFDIESKSRDFFFFFFFFFFWGGGGGGGGGLGEEVGGVQGRRQFSCGHVDNDRIIIHDDDPNQGFFAGGGGVKWGQSRGTR